MNIKRDILEIFRKWKNSPRRKPMLLQGARQIGKTWAVEQFGKTDYEFFVKFDLDRSPEIIDAFKISKEPSRVIKELQSYSDVPLLPGRTLIFFDEIQESEEAFNSLKYFCEDAPEYHIIAAGSLLGVAVRRKNMKVPVGKVNRIEMYPATFREFLRMADPSTFDYVENLQTPEHLPTVIFNKLSSEYRRYQICGGMPEAASLMLDGAGMAEIDAALQDILNLDEVDFSKYAQPQEVTRIRAVWHSLPAQLSKENRKFIYKVIRTGSRAKDYESALTWLVDAGLVYQIFNVSKPSIPLSGYEDREAFKLYACDCGLLRRLAGVKADVIQNRNAGYTEFKGAMAENIVLQALLPRLGGEKPYYWTSEGRAEIEFIIDISGEVIPLEVKAEGNTAGRSLSVYTEKYAPEHRIRISMNNLQENGGLYSIPNPLADWMLRFITRTPDSTKM
ncbi:MAG: ATP-binding protein [Bacteroidales bacterium]|nr:ATP-binding protein [Bacteroidales bacterium]